MTCPGVVVQERPVEVEQVRQIAGQCSRAHLFVVRTLGQSYRFDFDLILHSVKVLYLGVEHLTLFPLA